MNIKNKLLIICSVFLLLVSLFTFTFASSNLTFTYNNSVYTLDNSLSEYDCIMVFSINGKYMLFVSKNPFFIDSGDNFWFLRTFTQDRDDRDSHIRFINDVSGLTEICNTSYSSLSFVIDKNYSFSGRYTTDNIIYTSFDLYDYDENAPDYRGDLVFQGAPQGVELMKVQEVEEIIPAIVKVIMMILPVCLVLFGILLVLYLIKSKNLLHL